MISPSSQPGAFGAYFMVNKHSFMTSLHTLEAAANQQTSVHSPLHLASLSLSLSLLIFG